MAVDDECYSMDPALVQITAGQKEIDRRMQAFMDRKRAEINLSNKREFCGIIGAYEKDDSCARTLATFVPRSGQKSHLKISKVENTSGPRQMVAESKESVGSKKNSDCNQTLRPCSLPSDVEERLFNMEAHLRLPSSPSALSVHQRLKALEDRILYLEGISPEYTQIFTKKQMWKKKDRRLSSSLSSRYSTLTRIDQRILELRNKLKFPRIGIS